MARPPSSSDRPELSREAILRYVAEHPEHATKREIARAFGVKGEQRVALKDLIADLQAEGVLASGRKTFHRPGALPPVGVLEITGRSPEGELLAEPVRWEEGGERPRIPVASAQNRGAVPGVGERILAQIEEDGEGNRTARVIRVLEKRTSLSIGVYRSDGRGGGRVEPVERKQSEFLIRPGDEAGAKDGDLVEVEPASRSRAGLDRARIRTVLGAMNSERAISTIALHAHQIPHVFPEDVLAEAEAASEAGLKDREDWRDLPLVTIDPADAKDHDDAVHARADDDPSNPGGFVITVAIADVSFFVRPGSALDREARRRGNSVYFPDRVVPMLPEAISNELCSLKDGVDRAALAVRMTISAGGEKRRHSFHRIVMRSRASLAYEAAQAAIDGAGGEVDPDIQRGVLEPLYAAYRALRTARSERAPLDLDLPERKLKLDAEGRIAGVTVPPRLDAHRLIEEFMILANVAAAETLEAQRQALIYRTHDSPALAKLESLRDFLRTLEIPLATAGSLRPSHFNGILSRVKDTENEHLVNEVVLRTQSQAAYTVENIGHFGLNLARYAHFTSPIRRYADLIVHRALVSALKLGEGGLSAEDVALLPETAEAISAAERRAMAAERDTVDRLVAHHLADRKGDDFSGRVTGVTKAGLFVALDGLGADGFVPIATLGSEFFHFDEASRSVVGTRSSRGYRLGDKVEVKLVEALPLAGSIQFEMLSAPRKLPAATGSFHKAAGRARKGRPAAPGRRRRRS